MHAPPPPTEPRPGVATVVPGPPRVPGEVPRAGHALRSAPERREIALILGLVLLLNYVPGGLLQFVNLRWGILLSQIFFIAGPVLLAIRWFYLDRRAVLPLRSPGPIALLGAVLGIIGLNHVINYAQAWQDQYFPMPELWRNLFDALTAFEGPSDLILLLLLVGVVPGVCEEILFRGFVQAGLRKALESDAKSVVVGALVFAGFHLNPWSFSFLLIVGLYLGFLTQRTGSLLPAMIAHALNNILSLLFSVLGGEVQDAFLRSAWSHTLACACLVTAALLLRRAPA